MTGHPLPGGWATPTSAGPTPTPADPPVVEWAWPLERLADALEALGKEAGLDPVAVPPPPLPPGVAGLERWVAGVAEAGGMEACAIGGAAAELDDLLRGAGPALLRLSEPLRFALLLGGRRRRVVLLAPDGHRCLVPVETLRRALLAPVHAPGAQTNRDLVRRLDLPPGRAALVLDALELQRVGGRRIEVGWILRLPASAPLIRQAAEAGLPKLLASALTRHTLQVLLYLASWAIVGRSVLAGTWDPGWLWGWVLTVASLVPLRVSTADRLGRLGLGLGVILKRRAMLGALQLDPDQVRRQGPGALIGRAIEAEAVESGALQGALGAVVGVVELGFAAAVLLAAGGWVPVLGLVTWLVIGVLLVVRHQGRVAAWTGQRLAMTDRLVEHLVGHRTRLAQQPVERWHDEEDASLGAYASLSRSMDASAVPLTGLFARAFVAIGLLTLAPQFLGGAPAGSLALGLGGVLLASAALARWAEALPQLIAARVAWGTVAPLLRAGRAAAGAPPRFPTAPTEPVLEGRGLSYRHDGSRNPVLSEVSFSVRRGDRVLLEGSSGGGKSTLVSLVSGFRRSDGGLLTCDGLDLPSLGADAWRQRIAAAPQFHDNHVLSETFAFNALMGRRWPASEADMAELDELARDLGLGPLIDRMPAGLMQQVGESGWQLSHGERSRLFLLRALLQRADVIVLDETFAALDPATLGVALDCVLRRAPALIVVAHP